MDIIGNEVAHPPETEGYRSQIDGESVESKW